MCVCVCVAVYATVVMLLWCARTTATYRITQQLKQYINTQICKYTMCVKKFGEWYQKTNKTENTNKLTLLALKIIAILHSTLLATFIKLLETVSKGLFKNRSQNRCHTFSDCRGSSSVISFPSRKRLNQS